VRCSEVASSGCHSLFLICVVSFSVIAGRFSSASLKRLSATSSEWTISNASSGQISTHLGSPSHRLHAIAFPVPV